MRIRLEPGYLHKLHVFTPARVFIFIHNKKSDGCGSTRPGGRHDQPRSSADPDEADRTLNLFQYIKDRSQHGNILEANENKPMAGPPDRVVTLRESAVILAKKVCPKSIMAFLPACQPHRTHPHPLMEWVLEPTGPQPLFERRRTSKWDMVVLENICAWT